MREKLVDAEKAVKINITYEKGEDDQIIRTLLEKSFINQSKQDREETVYKALLLQKVPLLPLILNEEKHLVYEVVEGETALKLLKNLEEYEIDSEEWNKNKDFIVNGISEWLTCFYLALFLTFGEKWILVKFDLKNIIFGKDGEVYFTDFEECASGFWEDEIAKICSSIINDNRVSPQSRNEIARSLRSKMISNLYLNKTKIDHCFLKLNNVRVR